MTAEPFVVEVERSGLVESTHLVDVAVTDAAGTTTAFAGDLATIAYLRSSVKPAQALACLENGWEPPGVDQIAIACASHNGEPEHVLAARSTLAAAGVDESALRCPPAWPFRVEDAARARVPEAIFHNCSGKHAAMLATAEANGWPADDYRAADHPMQRAVSAVVERIVGRPARHVGVDGCGVPTFAFALSEAAALLAVLDRTAPAVLDAMAAKPFLVAGTERLCTGVMSATPNVVLKIGAEGLACGTVRSEGIGFALKSRDGNPRGRGVAVVALLQMLGAIDATVAESLDATVAAPVAGGGRPVGRARCRGELHRA